MNVSVMVVVLLWCVQVCHYIIKLTLKGNLTAARYQHEVLDTEVNPLMRNHRGIQLLHDGAPAHLARATTAYLNANNVNVVDFPPKSPDLNISEQIWDELNRRTEAIPTTLNQLRAKRSLRVEQPPSELRSALCDVNKTSLSCRGEQCGMTYPLLSLHRNGRPCWI